MSEFQICFVLGTRPEIIKLSPVIRVCKNRDIEFIIIHTGQHYSDELDTVFFERLNLPTPEYNLEVGSGAHGEQTAKMLTGIERILEEQCPDVVMVQGDTNSVLAGGLVGSKMDNIAVAHVEAGLRSFDRTMPEETNRRLVDHASDYLFAPTETAYDRLLKEAISTDCVYNTGNTVVDAVQEHSEIAADNSTALSECGVIPDEYALLTAHRAGNVDDAGRFTGLLTGIDSFAEETGLDVVYPIHPRAQKQLEEFDLKRPSTIQFVDPLDYLDFLKLERDAAIIFTDSGGVQEEACILGTPCVTLRENTERPETIDVGANLLVGTDPERILEGGLEMLRMDRQWSNPFGDGTAAEQILDIILEV